MKDIHSLLIHFSRDEMTFEDLNELATSLVVVANLKATVYKELCDRCYRMVEYVLVSRNSKAQLEFQADLKVIQEVDRDENGLMMSINLMQDPQACVFGMTLVFPKYLDRYEVIEDQVEMLGLAMIAALDLRTESGSSIRVDILENKRDPLISQSYTDARSRLLEIFGL